MTTSGSWVKTPDSLISQRRATARGGKSASYQRRRAEIIEAAAVGADRATLDCVGGRQELLDEVVTDVVRANLATAAPICASDDAALEKQENLAHAADGRQAWATQVRAVNRRYEAAVEGIIRQGIADGSLAPITEPRVLVYGLIGMVSWTNRGLTRPGPVSAPGPSARPTSRCRSQAWWRQARPRSRWRRIGGGSRGTRVR